MSTWSLCGRHAGPDKTPTPVFINLDNVLTLERQGDLTAVVIGLTRCQKLSSGQYLLRVLFRPARGQYLPTKGSTLAGSAVRAASSVLFVEQIPLRRLPYA
jgi:hypothetical protein